MANLGTAPVQIVANVLKCGRCGGELPGHAAGAVTRARYDGPVLAEVSITEGTHDKARTLHHCPAEEAAE